jgi:hypothetical protein
MVHNMATPALNDVRAARRRLGNLRRQLAETRESLNNIVPCDDNVEVIQSLEERETTLLSQMQTVTEELHRMEQRLDESFTPQRPQALAQATEVYHSIESVVHQLSVDNPSESASSHEVDLEGPHGPSTAVSHRTHTSNPATAINKVVLPELREVCQLKDHIIRFERVLMEAGCGVGGGTDGFKPLGEIAFSVCLRFCKTLSGFSSVAKYAEDQLLYNSDWTWLKNKLLERYCTTAMLMQAYEKKLGEIKFRGKIENFIDDLRDAWRLGRVICTNPALERKQIIHRIRDTVPSEIYHATLTKLDVVLINEWEQNIAFDSDDDKSFLGALAHCAKLAELSRPKTVNPVSVHHAPRYNKPDDRVARASGPPAFDRKRFHSVLVVPLLSVTPVATARSVDDYMKSFSPDKFRAYASKSSRSRGYLIGCDSVDEFDELTAKFESLPECKVRKFSENGERRPRPDSAKWVELPPTTDNVGKVSRAHAPNEYVVNGDLFAQCTPSFKLHPPPTLQLDSGAGYCYLSPSAELLSDLNRTGALRAAEPFSVTLADGSRATVSRYVPTDLEVYSVDNDKVPVKCRQVDLYLLPGESESPHVLLGRSAINSFDFVISKDGVQCSGVRVCDVNSGTPLPIVAARNVDEKTQFSIDSVLTQVTARGWFPMLRSPEYELCLRELGPDEPRDHSGQTHCFMAKIPPAIEPSDQSDQWLSTVRSRTRGMFSRLNPPKRLAQNEIVDGYLKAGWWKEASVDECRAKSRFSPVPCFLVAGNKKPRIVVNFKPVNKKLPKSSTPSTMPAYMVTALQAMRPDCVLVCDAASAFYKVRIVDDFLWLVMAFDEGGRISYRNFLSDRVVFGISCGPSALISSMHALFNDKALCGISAFSGWFVDDNAIGGSVQDVVSSLRATSLLLNRTGHELQVQKCFAICRESKRAELEASLAHLGPITVSESAEIFRATMSYRGDDHLEICCNDPMRRVVLAQLADLPLESSRLTKSAFFRVAGVLSYDLVKGHPQEKCIADSLRSLIGREFASSDWYHPLDLNSLTAPKQDCLRILSAWCRELSGSAGPTCAHLVRLFHGLDASAPELNLFVDASTTGGGFALCVGNDVVWQDAWRWSGSQTRWHINFQETTSILRGVRVLSDILHCLVSCLPRHANRPTVKVFNDNRSAVKWTTIENGDVLAKHQSRRTLMRMIDELSEEWKAIKAIANLDIAHLSGVLNVRADKLSRMYDRRLDVQPGSVGSSLADLLEVRKPKAESDPELSLLQGIELTGNAEVIEDESEFLADLDDESDDLEEFDPACKAYLRHPGIERVALSVSHPDPSDTEQTEPPLATPVDPLILADAICSLRAAPDHDTSSSEFKPWIEELSGWCYDMTNLRHYVRLLQDALREWHIYAQKERGRDVELMKPEPFELCVARSAQATMDRNLLPTALRGDVGPLIEFNGVNYYRVPRPDGTYATLPFIPASCVQLQTLYVRDCHRACAHMGVDYTQARLTDFVCHKVRHIVTSVVKHCLYCQRKNASRGFKNAFDMAHDRLNHRPYESIAVDHLSLGDHVEALVVMCMSTGHISLAHCADLTAAESLIALKRILFRYCAKPKFVLADRAANLALCVKELDKDVEFSQTTAYSQFENGKLERMNAVALSIMTYKCHFGKLQLKSLDPFQIQDLLDYVSCQLNMRPLGFYVSDPRAIDHRIPLTPHALMFGNCCELISKPPVVLDKWLTVYFEQHWKELKKRSELAVRASAGHTFYVREPVLLFRPGPSKINLPWTIAHVVDIIGNRVRVIDSSGKEILTNSYNLCPLRPLPDSESASIPTVSRVGARVELSPNDGKCYRGLVVQEREGQLLVDWEPINGTSWPREWCEPNELRFVG